MVLPSPKQMMTAHISFIDSGGGKWVTVHSFAEDEVA
jgi:hypothetical protein